MYGVSATGFAFRSAAATALCPCLSRRAAASECKARAAYMTLSAGTKAQVHCKERALVFPGQGSQFVGMGKEYYDTHPVARRVFEEADEVLGFSLSKLMFEGNPDTLNKTEHAQPAILTASIAVLRMLEHETGFKANQLCRFTMGHSLGEYTALVAAEALSLADGVRLVWFRGQKMQEAAAGLDPAMTALILRKATVNEIIDEVSKVQRAIDHELGQTDAAVRKEVVQVGNVNTSTQVTLSGTRRAVDKAIAHLHSRDLAIRAVSINVSAPFHSDLMAPAARSLKAEFERVMPFYPPTMTVISNATARPIGCHKDIGDILATQAVTTCRWLESMEYLKDQGTKRWFCVGPGSVIANMVRREYPEMIVRCIATPREVMAAVRVISKQEREAVAADGNDCPK